MENKTMSLDSLENYKFGLYADLARELPQEERMKLEETLLDVRKRINKLNEK